MDRINSERPHEGPPPPNKTSQDRPARRRQKQVKTSAQEFIASTDGSPGLDPKCRDFQPPGSALQQDCALATENLHLGLEAASSFGGTAKNNLLSGLIPEFPGSDLLGDYATAPTKVAPTPPAIDAITPAFPRRVNVDDFHVNYMEQLRSLVHPENIMEQNGYVLKQYSDEALERKKKCKRCKKAFKSVKPPTPPRQNNQKTPKRDYDGEETDSKRRRSSTKPLSGLGMLKLSSPQGSLNEQAANKFDRGSPNTRMSPKVELGAPAQPEQQPTIMRCKYHTGAFTNGMWTCCKTRHKYGDGCNEAEHHAPMEFPPGRFEAMWYHHHTPKPSFYQSMNNIRPAVAIDCEMGQTRDNEHELLRVSMVDYFTGEALVDNLVNPDERLEHCNTKYSGVTFQQLNHAIRSGSALKGKQGAREAVWRYVGPDTVVIGHGAYNDFSAMRWIHATVVDTMLVDYLREMKRRREAEPMEAAEEKIAAEASSKSPGVPGPSSPQTPNTPRIEQSDAQANSIEVSGTERAKDQAKKKARGPGTFSLKVMTKVKLGRDIQMAGNQGHCSLEDAIASRDIAHWHVVNKTEIAGIRMGQAEEAKL